MANVLVTNTLTSKESMRSLHNNLVFTKNINRQYERKWGSENSKFGSTFNARLPNQYTVRDGMAMQVQSTIEQTTPVTLNIFKGVDLDFTGLDLTVSVDLDKFTERYITPAMAKLTSYIDYAGLNVPIKTVWNQAGTPGTTPGTAGGAGMLTTNAPNIFTNAGVHMDNMGVPNDNNRNVILNPVGMSLGMVGLSGLFNPQKEIEEQYRRGILVPSLGFNFSKSQNINTLTNGTHAGSGTAVVNLGGQTGSSITTNGWTASSAILKAGEVVQFAGVYAVNPENQQIVNPYGALANFVLTADATSDATGAATFSISPAIIVAGTGVANGTVNVAPSAGAAITLMSGGAGGTATGTNPINIAYHADAFTFACAELYLPTGGVEFSARESYENFSLRITRQWQQTGDTIPMRIDILCGFAKLRSEMACRING